MPNDERILETIPNGILGIIPTKSCTDLGAKVDEYLTGWREHREHEHQHDAAFKDYYKEIERRLWKKMGMISGIVFAILFVFTI